MNLLSALTNWAKVLFPLYVWCLVAIGLVIGVPDPGVFATDLEWKEFLVLVSPAVTWALIAALDAMELFEFDNKGGRANFYIGWLNIPAAAFVIPTFFGLEVLSEGSKAVYPATVIMLVITAGMILSFRMRPGEIREAIDREINLVKFGTTWRPSKTKDHGSAGLADVRKAAKHYSDGDIIFGVAKPHLPESDSFVGKVVRKILQFKSPEVPPILKGSFGGHMLVTSGSGGGKTVSFVIPNALAYKAGSLVCIDPKSEVHAVTARARREHGHDVYKLKPGDIDTDSFNAIGWVDPTSATFTRDCMTVASWIFPDSSGGDDGGSYYNETAKRLFAFTVTYKIAAWGQARLEDPDARQPTMLDVYDFLFRSPDEINTEIEEIYNYLKFAKDDIFGQATSQIKDWAATFVGGDAEKTWPNTISSVQKNFWWIGDPSISSVISGVPRQGSTGKAFDAKKILNGKTSIYICIPLSVLESTPGLARLIVGAFLNAIFAAEGKTKGSTLFMVDEMQILGNFPILHQTALNQGRGYGITLAGIIQAPEALDKQAGDKTYDAWIDNTMLQQFFAIGGEETAERISKQIGDTTVENTNYSGSINKQRGQMLGADSGGVSISKERHARRVKTATEIMDLDRTYAVVFRRVGVDGDPDVGKKPMIVGTCFYKSRPELMALADPNPFEKKGMDDEVEEEILQLMPPAIQPPTPPKTEEKPMQKRDVGEWSDADPKEMMKRYSVGDPAAMKLFEAIQKLEDGDDLSDEMTTALAEFYASSTPTSFAICGNMISTHDLDMTLADYKDDEDETSKIIKQSDANSARIEKKREGLIAAKSVHVMMNDNQNEDATIANLLAKMAALSAHIDAQIEKDTKS